MEKIFNLLDDRLKENIYGYIDNLLDLEISDLNYKMGGLTEENWDNLSKEDRKNYIVVTLMFWNSRLEIKKLKGELEEDLEGLKELRKEVEDLTDILYKDYINYNGGNK